MAEKTAGISAQERESAASRRSATFPGTNGNGAGAKQLQGVIREPKVGGPEADFGDTADEDEGQEVKDLRSLIEDEPFPGSADFQPAARAKGDCFTQTSARQFRNYTCTRPRVRSKRHIRFAVISLVLVVGAISGIRYWLHSRLY